MTKHEAKHQFELHKHLLDAADASDAAISTIEFLEHKVQEWSWQLATFERAERAAAELEFNRAVIEAFA